MSYKKAGFKVLEKLNNAGYQAYFVGGFVRDYILDIESNDIDITTSATPQEVISLFEVVNTKGIAYNSVEVMLDGYHFEITTFRKDVLYVDNRHPQIEIANSIVEDLKRRDFTINALAMDISSDIIDIFGGVKDLELKQIKAIGNPEVRFEEDALRMLRACYFSSKLGFEIEEKTLDAIKKNGHLILNISSDMIKRELSKMLIQDESLLGLRYFYITGLASILGLENTIKYLIDNNLSYFSLEEIFILSQVLNESENDKIIISKHAKKNASEIKEALNDFNYENKKLIYTLGLDKSLLCAHALNAKGHNFDLDQIEDIYHNLNIKDTGDIDLSIHEIVKEFQIGYGPVLHNIVNSIIDAILYDKIMNEKEHILSFIKDCMNELN